MLKAIPVVAVLALGAASPVAAQEYRYQQDSTTTTPQTREESELREQQARTPESDRESPGTVETLRDRGMSAPNVKGDTVPEEPGTGLPRPEARGNPKQLESVPRP